MGHCVAETSLAHTYGNVTCFIAEYVKSMFPENYFKTVHISSTIAYKQFSIFQNKNKEFLFKNKPMLIIRPRMELGDSDLFLGETLLTTRIDDTFTDIDFGNLQPFIDDRENGNKIYYLMNRLKMLFDVTIVVESEIEQMNKVHFMRNRVRPNRPFMLTTALESYVPRELIELMAKDIGKEIYDENGSMKDFIDYLNSVSVYPVSYKLKNASGNDEWFRFYPANIETIFSDLSRDDGSKRGMINDAYTINFTISTEFYGSGLYYYFSKNEIFYDTIISEMVDANSRKIAPIFTINDLHTKRIADGWSVYAAPMYMVDTNNYPDELDISSQFNNSMRKMIEHHKENGIPLSVFIIAVVMKDNEQLVEGRDYVVDYDNMMLYTYKLNEYSTYRLILHINTLYVNSTLKEIMDLERER